MSPWSTSRAIPSPGSSPCPRPRPSTAPSTTGSGGASRPCSPTSRRAASAWRTATSAAPSAWTASSSSWPWPCSGRSRPACGTRSTTRRRTKKSPGSATPQPSPRPDLPLQARHPPPPGLPATARRPAAVVGRVAELMGGKEAAHPALPPAVVGVHVLDVEGAVAHPNPGRDIDRLVADAALGGEGGVGLGAVRAEDGVAGDHRPERRGDGVGAEVGQHGVGGVAGAVAGDQRRDLLGREAALARPLAAPARPSSGRGVAAAPSAGTLVGAAKEGLVRLDHAAHGLARRRGRAQEAVPPAEAGREVHPAVAGRLREAQAGGERLAVAQPAGLLPQPRQGGAGERVEGLAAGLATVAAQPAGVTPALQPLGAAVRAARRRGERPLEQPHRLGLARGRRQGPPERRPLLVAEPLDQVQQHLEIRLAHRSPRRHPSTGSLPPNNRREKSLLKAGKKYDVLPAAAAMIEVGLLDPEIAAEVLRRAAPLERLKETGGADVQH